MNDNIVIKEAGRIVSGAYYDYQQTRLCSMNRIRDVVRKKAEGISFDQVEDKKEEKTYDKKYSDELLSETLDALLKEQKISPEEHEYLKETLEIIEKTKALESQYKKAMMGYIVTEDIWTKFLQPIKGIGPILAANMIKEFGYCEKAPHVSSLWKYCGFDVHEGHAPKREKGKKLTYNPDLRTMMWKVGDSFIKQNSPIYREIYDRTKAAETNRTDENKPKSKGHAHARAIRKMIKLFLAHYWEASKEISGQETSKPYIFDKLHHEHMISWKDVVKANTDAKLE
jgi:hypothetical protein